MALDALLCQQHIPHRGVLQGGPSHPPHLQGGLGGVGKSQDLPAAGSLSGQAFATPLLVAQGLPGTVPAPLLPWALQLSGSGCAPEPARHPRVSLEAWISTRTSQTSPVRSFLPPHAYWRSVGLAGLHRCVRAWKGHGHAQGCHKQGRETLPQQAKLQEPPAEPGQWWPCAGEPPTPQPAETCFQPARCGWEGEKEASKAPASAARPPSCRGDGGEAAAAWYRGGSLKSFPPPTAPGLSGGVSSSSRVPACSLLGALFCFVLFSCSPQHTLS